MHFFDILLQDHNHISQQQQQQQQYGEEATKATTGTADHSRNNNIEDINNEEYNELVSLSLGFPSKYSTKDETKSSTNKKRTFKEDEENLGGLALGLDTIRFNPLKAEAEATDIASNVEGSSDEVATQTQIWPPSKVLKTMRSSGDITINEASQKAQLKKPRVSIRARCDTQTMNDGCQWRKYGQKIAKGNTCPRAYYRCAVSPSCPVRKQVQRCAGDMSILITTYEGTHNHPLPVSATPMASTTSLAASMLQSLSSSQDPSSSSSSYVTLPIFTSSSVPPTYDNHSFHYSNAFHFSDSSRPPHHHHQFCFTNSSISTTTSHPTITLDLTSPPTSSSSSSFSHQFRYLTSAFSPMPTYSPNISSSSTFSPYFHHAADYSKEYMNIGNHSRGTQPFLHQQQQHKALQGEIIAATTKAITINPNFQSAISASLTSDGAVNSNNNTNNNGAVGVGGALKLKLGGGSSYSSRSSLRYMNNNGVSFSSNSVYNAEQGNLILFPPTSSMASPVLPVASWSTASVSSDGSNRILEQWKTKNLTITSKESNLK